MQPRVLGAWCAGLGLAAAAVALASVPRLALAGTVDGTTHYAAYYAAVMIVAMVAGRTPGLMTTAMGALVCHLLFITQPEGLWRPLREGWIDLLVFIATGVCVSVAGGQFRTARERARGLVGEARAQAERAQRLLDSTADAYMLVDHGWTIIDMNRQAEPTSGAPRDRIIGRNFWEVFPRGEKFRERYDRALETGRAVHFEEHYTPLDQWFAVSAYPVSEGLLIFYRDVTERRRAEQDLRNVLAYARCILWHAQITGRPGWEQDVDGSADRFVWRLVVQDEQAAQSVLPLDLLPGERYGERWTLHRHPEDALRTRRTAAEALIRGDRYYCQEFRCRDKFGQEHWLHEEVTVHELGPGRWRAFGVVTDVTPRHQVEQALRDSEQRLRALASAVPLLVWTAQPDGKVDFYNDRVQEYDGFVHTHDGQWQWHAVLHEEDAQRTQEAWRRAVTTGEIYQVEHRVRMRDGRYRWHLSRGVPQYDEQGNIVKWFGTATDIEVLKQAEQEMRRAKTALEEANIAKDHFLAVLSHELRTPLTPVLAAAAALEQRGDLPGEVRQDIEMIRRNVELEARLIDDLLDVTRIVRGKVELMREPVSLREIIRRAVEVCRPDIVSRGLEVGVHFADACAYLVHADAARLQQVFWNLLKNAIKFTPPGGSVALNCRTDDGMVVVEVRDSGIGIDPDVLPRLFTAFEQGGPTTTRQFGGLGLGLVISKGLVEMHGGTIAARSDGRGRGATFEVRLPAADAALSQVNAPAPEEQESPLHAQALNILLVEDHRDTAAIMRRLLVADGYAVMTAEDMTSALQLIGRERFDLLVCDLGLPDGSGIDLVRQVRSVGHTMPAIALTGYGRGEDVRRSREAGFVAHLVKPIAPDHLRRTIREVSHRGNGRG